jgi:outer membrane protein assembly factor BamB/3',5'-cyclic AMP phosphodiesterase CpdA
MIRKPLKILPKAAVCLLLALAVSIGLFTPIANAHTTKFTFIVSSDSHIGAPVGNKGTKQAFQDMTERYPDASFMINMGDVTETGSSTEYDLFREYATTLPFKVYAAMGNHESRWQDRQGSLFAKHFGNKNYSFDYGSWHFLVLDTTYPGQTLGTLDPATIAWIEQDLSSIPPDRPVAVFSHHPFCYEPRAFQDSDDAFVELLDRYPIRVVFSGHGHSFITWKAQGRTFEMVGALMDSAYAVVDVNGTSMSVRSVTGAGTSQREERLRWQLSETVNSSPISEFTVHAERGLLRGDFQLAEPASVSYQIDGEGYQDLGLLQEGPNQLSCSVAAHPKGTHTLRIRATTNSGPYFASREFSKDPDLVAWRTELGSAAVGDMVHDGQGAAIVGTRDGMIRKIRLSDGLSLWEHRLGAAWGGGVLLDNKLYFGDSSGRLSCFNASDGTFVWSATLDESGFSAAPLAVSGPLGRSIIIGSSSGTVYAVNAITAAIQWKYQAGGAVTATPASAAGKVLFGAWDGSLYALNLSDGSLAWQKTLGRQIYYSPSLSPAVSGGTVYVTIPYDSARSGSYLYAISASTGEKIWEYRSNSSLAGASIPDGPWPNGNPRTHLGVLDGSGNIRLLSRRDGTALPAIQGTSSLFATFASGSGVWVTGGYRGQLTLVRSNGTDHYKVRDSFLMHQPLIAEGILVQCDSRGTLWGIRLAK